PRRRAEHRAADGAARAGGRSGCELPRAEARAESAAGRRADAVRRAAAAAGDDRHDPAMDRGRCESVRRAWPIAVAVIGALLVCGSATAEPYLAVQTGFKCRQCHVDPTGGGKRNVFGSAYALNELAARI